MKEDKNCILINLFNKSKEMQAKCFSLYIIFPIHIYVWDIYMFFEENQKQKIQKRILRKLKKILLVKILVM